MPSRECKFSFLTLLPAVECCNFRKEFCHGIRKTVHVSASPELCGEGVWFVLHSVCLILGFKELWDNCNMNFSFKSSTQIWQILFLERKCNLCSGMVMHSVSCGVHWQINVTLISSPSSSSPLHPRWQLVCKVTCCVSHWHFRSILEESFDFSLMSSRSSAAHMMTPSSSGIFWMTQLPRQNPLVPRPEHTPTSPDK